MGWARIFLVRAIKSLTWYFRSRRNFSKSGVIFEGRLNIFSLKRELILGGGGLTPPPPLEWETTQFFLVSCMLFGILVRFLWIGVKFSISKFQRHFWRLELKVNTWNNMQSERKFNLHPGESNPWAIAVRILTRFFMAGSIFCNKKPKNSCPTDKILFIILKSQKEESTHMR